LPQAGISGALYLGDFEQPASRGFFSNVVVIGNQILPTAVELRADMNSAFHPLGP
jgi:hypothetical protein